MRNNGKRTKRTLKCQPRRKRVVRERGKGCLRK